MARIPDQLVELVNDEGEVIETLRLRFVTEIVHACPEGGSGFTPCCNRTPFELPRNSRMTVDPALVTCQTRREKEQAE